MLTGRELTTFRKKLLGWFRQYQRDLPWRRSKDPYRIWLSEIMLQQTRVAAVIPYYERFLERFPDIHALASALQGEVLRLWSGLGYYSRARNLQRAAQEIVAKHGGAFPVKETEALALPGIGNYTAAAILSIAYGAGHAVLDGNVARVLARLFAMRGDLREGKRWQSLQASANALLERRAPGDWNQAMMELGATVCTPRAPQCLLCPVAQFCEARRRGVADSIPARRKKRATEKVVLAAAVLLDPRGRTLLLPPPELIEEQNPSGISFGSAESKGDHVPLLVSRLWHFPTVAVRSEPEAELWAYLGQVLLPAASRPGAPARGSLAGRKARPLQVARHTVTYRVITVHPFSIQVARLPELEGAKIMALSDVVAPSSLAISNLTRKVARAALGVLGARAAGA